MKNLRMFFFMLLVGSSVAVAMEQDGLQPGELFASLAEAQMLLQGVQPASELLYDLYRVGPELRCAEIETVIQQLKVIKNNAWQSQGCQGVATKLHEMQGQLNNYKQRPEENWSGYVTTAILNIVSDCATKVEQSQRREFLDLAKSLLQVVKPLAPCQLLMYDNPVSSAAAVSDLTQKLDDALLALEQRKRQEALFEQSRRQQENPAWINLCRHPEMQHRQEIDRPRSAPLAFPNAGLCVPRQCLMLSRTHSSPYLCRRQ